MCFDTHSLAPRARILTDSQFPHALSSAIVLLDRPFDRLARRQAVAVRVGVFSARKRDGRGNVRGDGMRVIARSPSPEKREQAGSLQHDGGRIVSLQPTVEPLPVREEKCDRYGLGQ